MAEAHQMVESLKSGEEEAHIQIYNYKANGSGFWNDLYIYGYVHEDDLMDDEPPLPAYHVAFLKEIKSGKITNEEREIQSRRSKEIFKLKRLVSQCCEANLFPGSETL